MRLSILSLVLLAGCAGPSVSWTPAPEPPRGAYVRATAQADDGDGPPAIEARRALEAEWPPVGLAPEQVLPERRRQVRPRVRWVTGPDGAVIEVAAVEAPLLACPITIRVVRLPDPPAFLLDPAE